MGLFTRRVQTAKAGYAEPIKAAAGVPSMVGKFYNYNLGTLEQRALSIPAISRARDLMASMVGSCELKHYQQVWDSISEEYREVYLPRETWMDRPDPKVSRQFILANTFSDLFFYGSAVWLVTGRYANGYPATFTWLPKANVSYPEQAEGVQMFGNPTVIEFNGVMLNPADCIVFLSPTQGIVYQGARAINIAVNLDQYADRLATTFVPPGYFQQKDGGETMEAEELTDIAAALVEATRNGGTFGLNHYGEFVEFKNDRAAVVNDARKYQALDIARLANIPPWLLGIDVGGYNYQNAQDAQATLYLYGTKLYLDCIEQRLSQDDVLPRGRYVEFDVEDYISEAESMDERDDAMSTTGASA